MKELTLSRFIHVDLLVFSCSLFDLKETNDALFCTRAGFYTATPNDILNVQNVREKINMLLLQILLANFIIGDAIACAYNVCYVKVLRTLIRRVVIFISSSSFPLSYSLSHCEYF